MSSRLMAPWIPAPAAVGTDGGSQETEELPVSLCKVN